MAYFRQLKHQKTNNSSMDGFVSRDSKNISNDRNFSSRFTNSYQPKNGSKKVHSSTDGFISRDRRSLLDDPHKPQKSLNENPFAADQMPDLVLDEPTTRKSRRHSRKQKRADKRHNATRFRKLSKNFAIVCLALFIGVASLFGYGYLKARNIFKGNGEGAAALQENVDPARLNGEGDGRVNILLIGKGGPGHDGPDLADTLILASIDPIKNEAALVSVPRDLYVQDKNGYSSKINAVYSNAKQNTLAANVESNSTKQLAEDNGLQALKSSVSEVLGVPVHYYVMVDFKAFEESIDTVGGITIDVKEPLYDRTVAHLLGGSSLVADAGMQTFDGERALLYARSRMGSARGDFDRSERQREVIVAMQQKALSLGTFSNPFKVVELLNQFGDGVRTDLNGLAEIKRLYEIGQNIASDNIASVGLVDPPNVLLTTGNVGGQSIVLPVAGLYQYSEIQSFIRNKLRDAFLQSEDATILILNGTTTPGLATATMEELKSYGYNVLRVDNAPTSDYSRNVLIDVTGENKYTKSYLERRVGLTSTSTVPTGVNIQGVDFVIILGTDEISKTTN